MSLDMQADTPPEASTLYVVPKKCILSPAHLAAFKRSPTHRSIVEFIDDLNDSIVDKTLDDAGEGSEASLRACKGQRFLSANLCAVRQTATDHDGVSARHRESYSSRRQQVVPLW